jgi:hypothetical protein
MLFVLGGYSLCPFEHMAKDVRIEIGEHEGYSNSMLSARTTSGQSLLAIVYGSV